MTARDEIANALLNALLALISSSVHIAGNLNQERAVIGFKGIQQRAVTCYEIVARGFRYLFTKALFD